MIKYTIFGIISLIALILDLLSGDTKTIEVAYHCELITIALIVGGALTAKSQIEQGRAARAQGRTQEAIAQRNALLAERQAEAEQQAAIAAARKQEREGEVLKGRQRAAFAKAGVLARGTPLAVLVETAETLEADRLTILREGAISAAQRRGQAGVLRAQGAAAKARGKAAGRAANLAAAGTILTTVGTVGVSRQQRGLKPFSPGKA